MTGKNLNQRLSEAAVLIVNAGEAVVRMATKARESADASGAALGGAPDRWHTVTINCPPEKVAPDGEPPEPLAALGDGIEVEVRPAPGGRGTELAARVLEPVPSGVSGVGARVSGQDPRQALRAALRASRQLIETGEVLTTDGQPTGRRSLSPAGRVLETATHRAYGEGLL